MIGYVIAALVLAFLAGLVLAAVTGRAQVRSCCAIADPAKDLRMRAAFSDARDQR
jgi:hypothetical protein